MVGWEGGKRRVEVSAKDVEITYPVNRHIENPVEDQRGFGTVPEWADPFSNMGAALPPSTKLLIPQGECRALSMDDGARRDSLSL